MLDFEIASDLYTAGVWEDGHPYTANMYYILATDNDGNRWMHYMRFPGCSVVHNEEGFPQFVDIREQALTRANQLLAAIEKAQGQINLQYWTQTTPMHGSLAYQFTTDAF